MMLPALTYDIECLQRTGLRPHMNLCLGTISYTLGIYRPGQVVVLWRIRRIGGEFESLDSVSALGKIYDEVVLKTPLSS